MRNEVTGRCEFEATPIQPRHGLRRAQHRPDPGATAAPPPQHELSLSSQNQPPRRRSDSVKSRFATIGSTRCVIGSMVPFGGAARDPPSPARIRGWPWRDAKVPEQPRGQPKRRTGSHRKSPSRQSRRWQPSSRPRSFRSTIPRAASRNRWRAGRPSKRTRSCLRRERCRRARASCSRRHPSRCRASSSQCRGCWGCC